MARIKKLDALQEIMGGTPTSMMQPEEVLDMVGAFGRLAPQKAALDIAGMNPINPPMLNAAESARAADAEAQWNALSTYQGGAGRDRLYGSPAAEQILADPRLSALTPYLTTQEIQQMSPMPRHRLNALRAVADYPEGDAQRFFVSPRHDVNLDPKVMANLALAGSAKKGWYEASRATLLEVFGPGDAERFAALLAATSPQTSVESNLFNTVRIWKNWVQAGRPQDPEAILDIMGQSVQGKKGKDSILDAWKNNSVTALTSEDPTRIELSGPKVMSFYKNLSGEYDWSTNDTWMGRAFNLLQSAFGGNSGLPNASYRSINVAVRQAADMLSETTGENWTPANVQEAVWSYTKTLMDYKRSAESGDQSAVDLVDRAAITGEMIGQTPDFGTLFQNPTYSSPLVEMGVLSAGPQGVGKSVNGRVQPLQVHSFGAGQMPTPEKQGLMQFAQVLDDIDRAPLDTEAVNFGYETAPYAASGHLPELLADEEARRAYHQDPRSDWMPKGMSVDALVYGLGSEKAQPSRQGVGVWTPEGGETEYNDVTNPAFLRPDGKKDTPKQKNKRRQDFDALSMYRAAMGAQGGVGWNYPQPQRDPKAATDSAAIYYPKTLMPQQMAALSKKYPSLILSDTGTSVTAFPFDRGHKEGLAQIEELLADEAGLAEMLGVGTRVRPVIVRGDDAFQKWKKKNPKKKPSQYKEPPANAGYADLETEWQTPGQGLVTRRLLKSVNSATPAYRKYLEGKQVKASVQDLYDLDQELQDEKGYQVRPDLQLMRQRFLEGGFQGLQDALDRGEPLANLSALERFQRYG